MKTHSQRPYENAHLARVGLKLFFAICDDWQLNEQQQLALCGRTSTATLRLWRTQLKNEKPIRVSKNTLERLSLLAGIRKAIELLYPASRWQSYVKSPNDDFGGASLLMQMLNGRIDDLRRVRRYLDAQMSE